VPRVRHVNGELGVFFTSAATIENTPSLSSITYPGCADLLANVYLGTHSETTFATPGITPGAHLNGGARTKAHPGRNTNSPPCGQSCLLPPLSHTMGRRFRDHLLGTRLVLTATLMSSSNSVSLWGSK